MLLNSKSTSVNMNMNIDQCGAEVNNVNKFTVLKHFMSTKT